MLMTTTSFTMQRSLITAVVLLCVSFCSAVAQRNPRLADEEAGKAIDYMNANLPESAIEAWNRAIIAMPGYTPYVYEKTVSLVMAKRYHEALTILEPVHTDTSLKDRGYQLMGNCYDFLEDTTNSRRYYRAGLIAWPTSGRLLFEIGQQYYLERKRGQANSWWLKGTQAEPAFATNYYWLARSYSETKERLWAALYGEAFLNLERNSPRTREMSRLVFDMWNRSLRLGDSTDPINFCSDELLETLDKRSASVMSFPVAFEFTVAVSSQVFVAKDSVISVLSIEKLVDIRYRFMRAWVSAGYDTTHPNTLLAWNKRLQEQGRLKDYLWWLYGYGDKNEMQRYYAKNGDRYDTFLVWFSENGMRFDSPLCLGLGCP